MEKGRPTYELAWIQFKVSERHYRITRLAADGAQALGFDEADITSCIAAVTAADFHKSMESEQAPGLWQDVYRPWYDGIQIYMKLQIDRTSGAVIVQFKQK